MKNVDPVDGWTAVHVTVGAIAALTTIDFQTAMIWAVAYEVFEQALERSPLGQRMFQTHGPESAANVATDRRCSPQRS